MNRFRVFALCLIFTALLPTFAFADVAGGSFILGAAVAILVPTLAIALILLAVAMLVKAIRRKKNK